MRTHKCRFASKGFSLIEILIAITLLSIVTLSVQRTLRNSYRSRTVLLERDNRRLNLQMALSIMDGHLSQLYSPLTYEQRYSPPPKEEDRPTISPEEAYASNQHFAFPSYYGHPVPRYKQPDKTTFEFFTVANRRLIANSPESRFAWIRYTLQETPPEDLEKNPDLGPYELVYYLSAQDIYNPREFNFDDQRSYILLSSVEDIEFSFWSPASEKFVTKLNEVENGEHKLSSIRLTLKWKDERGQSQTVIKTFSPLGRIKFEPEDLNQYKYPTKTDASKGPQ